MVNWQFLKHSGQKIIKAVYPNLILQPNFYCFSLAQTTSNINPCGIKLSVTRGLANFSQTQKSYMTPFSFVKSIVRLHQTAFALLYKGSVNFVWHRWTFLKPGKVTLPPFSFSNKVMHPPSAARKKKTKTKLTPRCHVNTERPGGGGTPTVNWRGGLGMK